MLSQTIHNPNCNRMDIVCPTCITYFLFTSWHDLRLLSLNSVLLSIFKTLDFLLIQTFFLALMFPH